MANIYTVTLRKPSGALVQYNVKAADALTATTGAVDKAKTKLQSDEDVIGEVYGFNTLAEDVVE
jgi:hypothetical protein